MKKALLLAACIAGGAYLIGCGDSNTKPPITGDKDIQPAPFPTVNIPGFVFPEDSNKINQWLNSTDSASIISHGWGIWAGLTTLTGDSLNGSPLYVYETWQTPEDLQNELRTESGKSNGLQSETPDDGRQELHEPNQFEHAAKNIRMNEAKQMGEKIILKNTPPCNQPKFELGVYTTKVTVAYDIPAAQHIISNKLYDSSALAAMQSKGMTDIPDFPNTSIVIKPTYQIIPKSKIVDGYFAFRVWNGPNYCDSGFDQDQWRGVVFVDINNKSNGNGNLSVEDNPKRTAENTYNLNTFIHYTLSDADAKKLGKGAQAGDIAILVGMHVTSKEIKRWTWQTYWWTPNPDMPPTPSCQYIASKRPAEITGAPAHYAMSIGYTFIWPNQPYSGGNNKGTSIIAFNPFLEAGFSIFVFYAPGVVQSPSGTVYNKVGSQTGCMSCHALATFDQKVSIKNQLGNYIPDTYIDMVSDSNFKNRMKLDFLWSIQGSIIKK